jgi:hypothetical protein
MSDLEQRLSDALADGAQGAPAPQGLAAAARLRARERRRARVAAGAAAAVLAIGVPTATVALRGDHGSDRVGPARQGGNAQDPNPAPSGVTQQGDWPSTDGYRWESWHGVSIQVPDGWGYGSLSDWCAGGGELTPRVQRPGVVSNDILCEPASTYGISFQEIDNRDDFEWPDVHQDSGGWPEQNAVGGRGIGGVLVMVATPEADEGLSILATMRPIGPDGDANGCRARLTGDGASPPEGGLSVCRYDGTGALEQSEALFGEDAGKAVTALQAAPDPGACADTSQGSQPHEVVVMKAAGVSARVDLVAGCPRVTVDGKVRDLTSDVVYWALSPGWSGEVPAGVPLPPELRRG